jgi:hypothetical protein
MEFRWEKEERYTVGETVGREREANGSKKRRMRWRGKREETGER